ncbi:olfactory receptor 6M1-like [Rhinatrema bivittatum]|uniref:olfactory receptor 6M1-like n=1 Tax=Rhinatrema bivittatum TaxID=194408 RepID=UPI0011298222|nr:olfactory receptor 6M1-like [Rhinatrema bivittatum]XP_029441699.1 olfactory receptor 6M1-like [Rhinatrema bivittatum]
MYFFLCNLSFLDISYTSLTLPKLLDILLRKRQHISAVGCFTQMHIFSSSIGIEYVLLTIMAYDRYVAICHPLHYAIIVNPRLCLLIVAGTWVFAFLQPVAHTVLISHYAFCRSNVINHFFCDISVLLKLSCSSTFTVESINYIAGAFIALPCLILTLTSYIYIISSILRIRSTEGRSKAFSTCSSHLTVVILFYGTTMFLYMRPTSMQSLDQNKLFALLYNVLIPMLNPLIYSLKNKAVKEALRQVFIRNCFKIKH